MHLRIFAHCAPEMAILGRTQARDWSKEPIRVHLQDLGHPVCGDIKYGNGDDPVGRLCLHAYRLDFYHPITNERLHFETPTPKDFLSVFKDKGPKTE